MNKTSGDAFSNRWKKKLILNTSPFPLLFRSVGIRIKLCLFILTVLFTTEMYDIKCTIFNVTINISASFPPSFCSWCCFRGPSRPLALTSIAFWKLYHLRSVHTQFRSSPAHRC
ncbi:hypothetical protein, unlikely [Trypanosoma brucei gambiense DAL972]|uniref:Uncharacterized protein n=1 Tax=Trypanosoma brucei gambiense (strain MHOM/CI/86/DAL972) TaxID=679716 RepID=D0A469_TRYB9|nr:hypothetical protein, unlikely [Trypanosoma brucei gambiense DAL972]CBH16063.1 hypothetical protein, unlikely [Trypanosoma brucei gambiense DAL972]|eukprot:XP_011778327.1 hypothetical protein, unlikely [Trypanosoma brucei gambiense DAL972]